MVDSNKNEAHSGHKQWWYVVANAANAVCYGSDVRRGPIKEIWSAENDAVRMKTSGLISDRGGRSFDSKGAGRHTMANEKEGPKQHATVEFSRRIGAEIVAGVKSGKCRGFAIIAAPKFLGHIRAALSTRDDVQPFLTIDKDVVTKRVDEIEALVLEHLG